MTDDAIDTTSALPSAADLRNPERLRGRQAYTQEDADAPVPTGPPAAGACAYHLSTRNGKVYAVELAERWIPVRVAGPFAGDQLRLPPHEQDWSSPTDARQWNAATLVLLCDAERARLINGVTRRVVGRLASSRLPLPARPLSAAPVPPAVG